MQCKMKVLEDVNAYSDTEKRENVQDYLIVSGIFSIISFQIAHVLAQ